EFVIKPEYDYIEFLRNADNKFYAVYLNTPRYGVIDDNGRIMAPVNYENIGNEREGLFIFRSGKKFGYINPDGTIAISAEYDKGLAKVRMKGKFGFIDDKGKWAVHPHYKEVSDFNKYNLAIARKRRKYGVINRSGHHVTHFTFQKVGKFSEGYAAFQDKNKY